MIAALLDPAVLNVVHATLEQALVSTAIAAAFGVPLGAWLARTAQAPSIRGWVWLLLSAPLAVPSVIAASAWTSIFAVPAFSGWGYSLRAVILAHVFLNVPLVALWSWQAIARVPRAEIELGRSLGLGRLGVWRRVILPRAAGGVGAAILQAFHYCSTSFVLVMVLGGGPAVQTLETAIYAEARFGLPELPRAMALAFWQVAIQILPWLALSFWQPAQADRGEWERRGRGGWLALPLAAVWLVPYGAVIAFQGSDSLGWAELGASAGISAAMALAVAALALLWAAMGLGVLGALERRGAARAARAWWIALQGPAAVSGIVLSLGFVLAFPASFGWGAPVVVFVQSVLLAPMALRLLWGEFHAPVGSLHELARSLGASARARWLAVEWPRWRGPVLTAGAWICVAALGEVAVWSFFQPIGQPTLPALLARWMAQYRFDEAQAASLVLLALSVGALAAARRGWRGAL